MVQPMHIVITGIALLLLIAGIIFNQSKLEAPVEVQKNEVLSEETENSSDDSEKEEETETSGPIGLENKPDPNIPSSLTNFYYPGAYVNSSSTEKLELESSDDPNKMTDWYKNKISSLGLHTQTFMKTNANGKVLNKLAGVNGSIEFQIEISKNTTDSRTKITITVSSL